MNTYTFVTGIMAALIVIGIIRTWLSPILVAFVGCVIMLFTPGQHMLSPVVSAMVALGFIGAFIVNDGHVGHLDRLTARAYGAVMLVVSIVFIADPPLSTVPLVLFTVFSLVLLIMAGLLVRQWHEREDVKYSLFKDELDERVGNSTSDMMLLFTFIMFLISIATGTKSIIGA